MYRQMKEGEEKKEEKEEEEEEVYTYIDDFKSNQWICDKLRGFSLLKSKQG